MPKFHFFQRFAPPNHLRLNGSVMFIDKMQEAFGVSAWLDSDNRPVEISLSAVEHSLLAHATEADIERFSVNWVIKSAGSSPILMVCIGTGGDQWNRNSFNLDFSRANSLPDLRYFRECIELTRPCEAYILEEKNDNALRERRRQKSGLLRPADSRPLVLHWFHYLDNDVVEELGGPSHCLLTPVFKVEQFCDGVLFQLTAEPFDPDDANHVEVQRRGMDYLGIG